MPTEPTDVLTSASPGTPAKPARAKPIRVNPARKKQLRLSVSRVQIGAVLSPSRGAAVRGCQSATWSLVPPGSFSCSSSVGNC
jgi:hypothetical protein